MINNNEVLAYKKIKKKKLIEKSILKNFTKLQKKQMTLYLLK